MSLRSEIEENYQDSVGLVAPAKCPPNAHNPSGNGICYLGEYMMILHKRHEMDEKLEQDFFHSIFNCMVEEGLLERGPLYTGEAESVDDYYGLAAGCVATDHAELAEAVIDRGWKHWGSFNDKYPNNWTWDSWLWRQPQLMIALYIAAKRGPSWYKPWTWWLLPHLAWTVLVLAFACSMSAANNWDHWRLTWLLATATEGNWLCKMAAKPWYSRLHKVWGPEGMKSMASVGYYQSGHPFGKYWVD